MPYYTPQQLEDFYAPYLADTAEGYVLEDADTGELAYVSVDTTPIADADEFARFADIFIDDLPEVLGDANSPYTYMTDHSSDTGISGWNLCATIDKSVFVGGGYGGYRDDNIVRVDVPLPSMEDAEYEDFPDEELCDNAMRDAIERVLDLIGT